MKMRFPGFKILDRYILGKFLSTYFFAIAMIIVIVVVFDYVEKIDDFTELHAPLKSVILDYYLNFIPYFINQFSGLFTFIACIFFTSKMAYQTEIVAMLSGGMSFRRLMWPYFLGALIIGSLSLTLNLWLYDFQRMPFWQYALQDLQGRLRYFTLQEVRFFPFHYPNAVDLLFYTSLTHYRLYIIAWTGAAAFAVSRVAARLGSGDALALGGFALALAAAPIWNEGIYSYYAVPQRALFWAMTAWLCLFAWQGTRHRRWAVLGAVLSFIACGTYEIGYVFALLVLVVWLLRRRSVKNALLDTAPALGGMGAALVFHVLCGRNGGTGNELSLDIPAVLRVTVQQMAASLPGLNSRLLQEDAGVITNGDRLWPLALGVLAGLLIFFGVPFKKLRGRTLGALAGFGLAVWALPALLLALSARYQQPEAITWQWGYIPAAASSIGFTLLVAALLALLAGLCCKLPKVLSVVSRLALTAALAVGLCLNGGYLRGVVRTHHAENLAAYQFFVRTIEAGLADAVQSDDLILCNENVWDSNAEAESAFFSRFTGRALHAQVLWTENPATDGDAYAYQTSCIYVFS